MTADLEVFDERGAAQFSAANTGTPLRIVRRIPIRTLSFSTGNFSPTAYFSAAIGPEDLIGLSPDSQNYIQAREVPGEPRVQVWSNSVPTQNSTAEIVLLTTSRNTNPAPTGYGLEIMDASGRLTYSSDAFKTVRLFNSWSDIPPTGGRRPLYVTSAGIYTVIKRGGQMDEHLMRGFMYDGATRLGTLVLRRVSNINPVPGYVNEVTYLRGDFIA